LSPVNSNVTSWLWHDGSVLPTYTVTNAGTISVVVSNSCGTAYDTLVTNLLAATPPLDLGPDTSLCPGESLTITISEPGVNILWSDGSSNPGLIVNTPGLISAIISNSCGQSFDTLIANALPAVPILNLGTDQSLCPGEIITINPGIPNVTYLWNDGSTLDSFQTTQQTTITLTISNSCGTATDTLEVVESTQGPQVDLGEDILACEGEVVNILAGISGVNYLWQDGSTDPDFTTTQSGQIILQVSNNCGTDTDTILVDISGMPPSPSLGPDTTLCEGNILVLQSIAPAGTSIEWQDGSGSSSFVVTSPGAFTLLESNHCGTESDTILVTYIDTPAPFSLGPDTTLCDGEVINLAAPVTPFNIQWQDGTSTATYLISSSGLYTLSVTNQCGNTTDEILVTYIDAPGSFSLGTDTTLCSGQTYTLYAPAGSSDILWQDGSTAASLDVTGSGTFYVTASNSCGEAADTVHVDYVDTPLPFSLGPDTVLCPGETMLLSSPSIFYDVAWQDGSGMLHFVVNRPGIYSLQLSNDCGIASDEIEVDYDTHIPQFNLDASIPWCEGDVITLDATQSFAADYIWSTGSTNPGIEITAPGLYSVEVTVPCSTTSHEVDVYPGTDCFVVDINNEIYIPNVFSPNDDGINDQFAVSFGSDLVVTAMTGSIFDRWGNLVYSSEEIPFQWDGLFAGEEVLPGVYVYHIKCVYLEGSEEKEKVYAGDVTVVR
ncbi:MAG TPA: gliding motility-associated C-terminal domain-containing protein, partial [Saprospiraceae bacterium]|nr:gliding motility-associated C-terminal domain-containing protein [Saprospiraceae bacterium]